MKQGHTKNSLSLLTYSFPHHFSIVTSDIFIGLFRLCFVSSCLSETQDMQEGKKQFFSLVFCLFVSVCSTIRLQQGRGGITRSLVYPDINLQILFACLHSFVIVSVGRLHTILQTCFISLVLILSYIGDRSLYFCKLLFDFVMRGQILISIVSISINPCHSLAAVATTPSRPPHNQEALPRPVPKLVCIHITGLLLFTLDQRGIKCPLNNHYLGTSSRVSQF